MHVLLTGASSGIGAALAVALSKEGHTLTLVARRKAKLDEVADACPGTAHVLPTDLTDPDAVAGLVDAAEAVGGPVEALINNAGIELIGAAATLDPDGLERLFRLNLLTPVHLTRAVLPGMLDRGAGTIVDIASVGAFIPPPYGSHYGASKAALATMGHGLRWELRDSPVRVITVYPGPIETDMGTRVIDEYTADPSAGLPWGTADQLAQRIISAMARGKAEVFYPRFYRASRWFQMITLWIMRFRRIALRTAPAPEAAEGPAG